MDADLVRRYAGRLVDAGLGDRLHLIAGVAVPASARSARWMRRTLFGAVIPDALVERLERATDQRAEGRRICVEMIQQLAEVPGVAGAHIMAPLNESSIPAVIEDSGIRRRRG
jgi:methylenetetrahydrofolate reductase (NADPH)